MRERTSADEVRAIIRTLCAGVVIAAAVLVPARASSQIAPANPAQTAAPPMYRQLVPGLLARTRISADATANRRVELWDLLVGPAKRSAAYTLPGGAVIEVRAGSGRIVIAGQQQELRPGSTLAIPDGAAFELINARDDLGLSIRATVIIGSRR